MATIEFEVSKDQSSQRNTNTGATRGGGDDKHLLIGKFGQWANRTYIQFNISWSGIKRINSATLVLTTDDTHGATGEQGWFKCRRMTKSWSEGNAPEGEDNWQANDYIWLGGARSPTKRANVGGGAGSGDVSAGTEFQLDVLDLLMEWAPSRITRSDTGAEGQGNDNYGLVLFNDNKQNAERCEFRSADHNLSGSHPVLRVDYVPKETQPIVVATSPSGDLNSTDITFTGTFDDSVDEDYLDRVNVEVRKDGGNSWEVTRDATANERATGVWAVHISEVLPNGVTLKQKDTATYEWRGRVRDQEQQWSEWSGWVPFAIINQQPTVTALSLGTYATLANVYFRADWADPDGDPIVAVQVQARATTTPGDPAWDQLDGLLWDTGEVAPTSRETNDSRVRRLYTGTALAAGGYSWRVRVQDSKGAWSAWDYGTFTLTLGYQPEQGAEDLLSGYGKRRSRVRIVIMGMGANRGPGDVVAVIEDASNVGCSQMVNDSGELYFTIPADHPQIAEIEPMQRHYSVEFYRDGQWLPLFEGLITDFDATERDVVFYGIDYLGLLSFSVDARYNPADQIDKSVADGGSKYIKKTVAYVINDQLTTAKDANHSMVGFINVPTLDTPAFEDTTETLSINSAFKERLTFIVGLIQSAKQGTGRRTRLWAERTAKNNYRWRLKLEPGTTRDNLRLSYGELVQGYRVLAMGDFATKVYGIGRVLEEYKPRYAEATAPSLSGELATWGLNQRAAVWNDLSDSNDLRRRVKQMASELGRVGKRIALGLRVVGMEPFDGWNLCDSVPVDINHGAVNTANYGSGYWTIWGTEWRLYPDGHDELTLVLRPREDTSAPDADLIPARPISTAREWTLTNVTVITQPRLRSDGVASPLMAVAWDDYVDATAEPLVVSGYEVEVDVADTQQVAFSVAAATPSGSPIADGDYDVAVTAVGLVSGETKPLSPKTVTTSSQSIEVTVTPVTGYDTYRIYVEAGTGGDPHLAWEGTLPGSNVVEIATPGNSGTDPMPSLSTALNFTKPVGYSTSVNSLEVEDVAQGAFYGVRVRAYDDASNYSPFSTVATTTVTLDTEAPEIPEGFSALGGYRRVGLTWQSVEAADLHHYQVRYSPDDGFGSPDTEQWVYVDALASHIAIVDLPSTTTYHFQVRSIDNTGLVRTSDVDDTPVTALTNDEAGWCTAITSTPTLVPTADIVANSVVTAFLNAGTISADIITSGTLKVGDTGVPPSFEAYTALGVKFLSLTSDGLVITDPANESRALWLYGAELRSTDGYTGDVDTTTWDTTVGPTGINASAVTYGMLPGGHNEIPNSGFEMTPFDTPTEQVWTSAADWATGTSQVSVDVSTTELKLSSATY